jgi:hypothetical protein
MNSSRKRINSISRNVKDRSRELYNRGRSDLKNLRGKSRELYNRGRSDLKNIRNRSAQALQNIKHKINSPVRNMRSPNLYNRMKSYVKKSQSSRRRRPLPPPTRF